MNYYMKGIVASLMMTASGWLMADIAVVVHPSYAVTAATAEDLSKLFLAKTDSVSGGEHLSPVDQDENSALRAAFYDKVCGKNQAQMNSYWSRLMFTGEAQPPKVIEGGDSAVVEYVAKTKDAVGYVSASAVNAKVKVIATFPE